jgi:transcriptional regulator with XRE-family HTH domain
VHVIADRSPVPGKTRTYTPQTLDAVQVLGAQIARARRERGWTATDLAQRVGISTRTVSHLEHGSPKVALGIAFEAATLLGINLFGTDGPGLARLARQGRETLALLPARVRPGREDAVRDNF